MRALVLGAALVLLGAAPQDRPSAPPLDRVIDANISWSSDRALDLGAMIAVCRHRTIPCVIEMDPGGLLPPPGDHVGYWQETLQGLTVREALDVFVAADPRYHWGYLDGVIVVRPRAAWTDKRNRLNQEFPALSLVDADLGDVLLTVKSAAHGNPRQVEGTMSPIGRTVTTSFSGGSMLNGLAAIARADGQIVWVIGHQPSLPRCPTAIRLLAMPYRASTTCLERIEPPRPPKRD